MLLPDPVLRPPLVAVQDPAIREFHGRKFGDVEVDGISIADLKYGIRISNSQDWKLGKELHGCVEWSQNDQGWSQYRILKEKIGKPRQ
ncbi:hypothetical protein TNCV_1367911 [Trichonephila clavipes]|nr:hypothetical protein TNCV_1367911 [Trichonephila clavipes]